LRETKPPLDGVEGCPERGSNASNCITRWSEIAKTNPPRGIAERCTERCAKDLEQHYQWK
jgi:hypothetical protein